jgi:hypothetical protein
MVSNSATRRQTFADVDEKTPDTALVSGGSACLPAAPGSAGYHSAGLA